MSDRAGHAESPAASSASAAHPCDVSIVIPAYRNARSLKELAKRMNDTMGTASLSYELILIDDGSPDDTWQVIVNLANADPRVKGIRLSRNFGQHPAIAAGFDRAAGREIVLMDADLEDRPEHIPVLIARLREGVDVVYTIKNSESQTTTKDLSSRIFHGVFSRITGRDVPMGIGTLRAFTANVLAAIRQYPEYNVLYGPLFFYVGFSSAFVTVERDERRHGTSSYSTWKRLSLAARSLAAYTDLPNRIFMFFGAGTLAATILYSAIVVLQSLIFGVQLPSGLTLVVLLIMFFMSIVLMSLGVIGIYVFRVYEEVLRRPRYLVAELRNAQQVLKGE
jgi:polyisoprenyl-phosphate glycosyltransferase